MSEHGFERVLEIDVEVAEECRWHIRTGRTAADPAASAQLPSIHGLDARLVAGREFPLRKWFYAGRAWYYHRPATQHRLRVDHQFFELVDAALRPLCKLVLEAGLCTTPSCQGHFLGREYYAGVWREITREQDAVRREGLIVRDCEDEKQYRWRDPEFVLPWPSFDAFYDDVSQMQSRGFIGIAVPHEKRRLIATLRASPYADGAGRVAADDELTALLGQPLFSATVDAKSPKERDLAWKAITAYFAVVLAKSESDSPPGRRW
jgi:hypothetical protein